MLLSLENQCLKLGRLQAVAMLFNELVPLLVQLAVLGSLLDQRFHVPHGLQKRLAFLKLLRQHLGR